MVLGTSAGSWAQSLPELTAPVNDFAGVIDAPSAAELDRMIRALERASGDVVVVATMETIAPLADIRELAVKLFENRGRGIGQRGKDNGLLVVVAVRDRRVQIEVGYDLEQFVTDGFAGETSRQYMAPSFRNGEYGAGLVAGVRRIIQRIAEGRGIRLDEVPSAAAPAINPDFGFGCSPAILLLILFVLLVSRRYSRSRFRRRRRFWGADPWSGWTSGVGSFGGGSGRSGGGFGGGFGGFGGGRSGGGGGGASW